MLKKLISTINPRITLIEYVAVNLRHSYKLNDKGRFIKIV